MRTHAGCCFFFGGLFHHVQSFNALANQVCNSLLFLAVVGLTLPIAAATLPGVQFSENEMLIFSRIIAILLLAVYITYLYFQLMSHNDLFVASKDQEIVADNQNQLDENNPTTEGEGEEEEEEEQPVLTITAELLTLLTISIIVAMASECAPLPLAEQSYDLVFVCKHRSRRMSRWRNRDAVTPRACRAGLCCAYRAGRVVRTCA